MDETFEALCEILDDELIRQQTLLSLLQSQREAALNQNISAMEAKSRAMEAIISEAAAAESDRHRVLRILVDELAIDADRQTLSEIIASAPARLAKRLRENQGQLQSVMSEAKELAQINRAVLRRASAIYNAALDAVDDRSPERGGYGKAGIDLGSSRDSILLDQRG